MFEDLFNKIFGRVSRRPDSDTQKGAGTYVRDYLIIVGIICLMAAILSWAVFKATHRPEPEVELVPRYDTVTAPNIDYDGLYGGDDYYNPDSDGFGLNGGVENEQERRREQERERHIDSDITGAGWTAPNSEEKYAFAPAVLEAFRTASIRLYQQAYADGNFVFSPYSLLDYLVMISDSTLGSTTGAIGTWLLNGVEDVRQNGVFMDVAVPFSSFRNKIAVQHEFRTYNAFWTNAAFLPTSDAIFKNRGIVFVNDTERVAGFDRRDINAYIEPEDYKLVITGSYEDDTIFFSSGIFEVSWPEDAPCYYDGHQFIGLNGSTSAYFFEAPSGTSVYQNDFATIAVSPFNYNNYQFVAIQPSGDFKTYVSDFDYNSFSAILDSISGQDSGMSVCYPKFTVRREYNMTELLKSGGLTTPFTPSEDFGYFTVDEFDLGTIVHRSYFSLNGRGARTWDTVSTVNDAASGPKNCVWFDRPFMWMVIDRTTQVPVMMGSVVTTADS